MTKKAEKIIRIVTVTGPDEVRNCRCAERSKARAIGGGIYSKFLTRSGLDPKSYSRA